MRSQRRGPTRSTRSRWSSGARPAARPRACAPRLRDAVVAVGAQVVRCAGGEPDEHVRPVQQRVRIGEARPPVVERLQVGVQSERGEDLITRRPLPL
eukprot:2672740-Prymnesium_polylepis.2